MQKPLHIRTTVLPGGKVEIASPEVQVGQTMDVIPSPTNRPSVSHRGNG